MGNVYVRTKFVVAAISNNANSFGLRGHVLLAIDGRAFEAGRSDHGVYKRLNVGDVVGIQTDVDTGELNFGGSGWELPRTLPKPPQKVIDAAWENTNEFSEN